MNFNTTTILSLGIVLLTVIPVNKVWSNAVGEISYTFRYAIDNSQVTSQHWEERRADIVHGSYSFLEPTGKIRIVEYQVNGPGGFRAVVTYRTPPEFPLLGHLRYPKYYNHPITFAKPVNVITNDLFQQERTYPNLPQ